MIIIISRSWSCSWSQGSHAWYMLLHQSTSIRPIVHQAGFCKCVLYSMTEPTTWHTGKEYTRFIPFYIRHLLVQTNSCLSYNPFRDHLQQGDQLSSLEFCQSIQPILNELKYDWEIGFIDDLSMWADLLTLAKGVESIINTSTGFKLNTGRCDIIMANFVSTSSIGGTSRIARGDTTLSGVENGHQSMYSLQLWMRQGGRCKRP